MSEMTETEISEIVEKICSNEMECIDQGEIPINWWERWKNRQTEEIFEIEYKIRRTPIRVKKYDRNR